MPFSSSPGCRHLVALIIAPIVSAGCSSSGQTTIETPSVNPTVAAGKAIDLYDEDGNGSLSKTELAACPGILAAHERYDTNGDKEISRNEIQLRLSRLFDSGVGLTQVVCKVVSGRQAVAGATVRFTPDPFIEGGLKPASGITDQSGTARIEIPADQIPADQRSLRAMQPGVYRVEIEHPTMKQPAQPLGCEIDPASRGGTEPVFRL